MVEKQTDVLLISSTGENEDYLARLQSKGLSIILWTGAQESISSRPYMWISIPVCIRSWNISPR